MAFLHFLLLILLIIIPKPSHSLTCTSQDFTNNTLYKNCIDLPTLNSYLHWTYNILESSLSIAFLVSTATSNGWISWAINPSAAGMIGAQALIAFKKSDGSMTVKTYNVSSYDTVAPSDISFEVFDSSAEYSGGMMKIFATVALPKDMKVVQQVWQVGGSVLDGETPLRHDLEDANMNAMEKLELLDHAKLNSASGGVANGTIVKQSSVINSGIGSSSFIMSSKVGLFLILYSIFGI